MAPLEAARRGQGRGWEPRAALAAFSAAASQRPGGRGGSARPAPRLRPWAAAEMRGVGAGASQGRVPLRPGLAAAPARSTAVSSCSKEIRSEIRTGESLSLHRPTASSYVLDRMNYNIKKTGYLTTRFVVTRMTDYILTCRVYNLGLPKAANDEAATLGRVAIAEGRGFKDGGQFLILNKCYCSVLGPSLTKTHRRVQP